MSDQRHWNIKSQSIFSKHGATLAFIWRCATCSIFALLVDLFFFIFKKNIWLPSCWMLHYVHQPVLNSVCSLVDIACVFIKGLFVKIPAFGKDAEQWEWNQSSKAVSYKSKTKSWKQLKCLIELRGSLLVTPLLQWLCWYKNYKLVQLYREANNYWKRCWHFTIQFNLDSAFNFL